MFLVPVVTGISEEIDLTWKAENGKVTVYKKKNLVTRTFSSTRLK